MILVALVCLYVCLSVSEQHYSKGYERTFYGEVYSGTMKNGLNFSGDLGIKKMSK